MRMLRPPKPASRFGYFNSSPEVIRLVVLMYVRVPLWLGNVRNLLFERGIDIGHDTARLAAVCLPRGRTMRQELGLGALGAIPGTAPLDASRMGLVRTSYRAACPSDFVRGAH
jgi:hypothetical protein